jgi:hypothetical protein
MISLTKKQADFVDNQPSSWKFSRFIQEKLDEIMPQEDKKQ